MQTAANVNLVLTDVSSLKVFADSQTATSYGGFYQQLASELLRGIHTKQILQELGRRFVVLSEQAHAFRQMDALGHVSQILVRLPLSRQHQAVGRYYQAVCTQEFGRGDIERAVGLLEGVVEQAPPRYRVRAMQSLGANSIHQGDFQTALSLYREAAHFASCSNVDDAYATLGTQKMVAVITSAEGNHRGGLALLESLFPLAQATRVSQPHIYYDYLNGLAVELCEAGRLEEADNVSQIVLASPFARAYPEWRETRNEIALRGRRPSRATVAFSQRYPEVPNVLRLPVPEREDSLAAQSSPASEPARVLSLQEWNKKKMAKDSNDTHRTEKPIDQMDGKEMLLKIMALTGSKDRTDEELSRILKAIVKVLSEPKDKGKQ